MSISCIPDPVRVELWTKAAGRCQYHGCNKPLWRDDVTLKTMNRAYLAHIVADSPNGPRGDSDLSGALKDKFSNIMLLCDEHHRLIDKVDVAGHPVERLREFKRLHEERIERLTHMQDYVRTELVRFSARIKDRSALVTFDQAQEALAPVRYAASEQGIRLDLTDLVLNEDDDEYWASARIAIDRRLEVALEGGVGPTGQQLSHLSIFALAPIPLLIYFGKRLGDMYPADVYQCHRNPETWSWQDDDSPGFNYTLLGPMFPNAVSDRIAICLSLSGTIHMSEVEHAVGSQLPTYTLTIAEPRRDFLRAKAQLELFRVEWVQLLTKVREQYGPESEIHLFPAVPNSVAVEMGRVMLPKADPKIVVYDHDRNSGGFRRIMAV